MLFTIAIAAFGAMLIVMDALDKGVETFDQTLHFSSAQIVKLYLETGIPGPWSARDGVLYRGLNEDLVDDKLYAALREYLPPDTRIFWGTGAPPEPEPTNLDISPVGDRPRVPASPLPPFMESFDRPVATENGAYIAVRGEDGQEVGWVAVSNEDRFLSGVELRLRVSILTIVIGFFLIVAGALGIVVLRVTRPIDQIAAAHRAAAARNETLSLESRTDPLTGLLNRRGLFETLAEPRKDEPTHVAMLDIDHFKAVNDKRGHEAGDLALTSIASLLTSQVRAGDLCCRWGGEEFIIVLAGSKDADAMALAERVREAVAAMIVGAEDYEGAAAFGVTVTIGVAAIEAGELREAVAAADRALYDGKRRGRNRVIGAF